MEQIDQQMTTLHATPRSKPKAYIFGAGQAGANALRHVQTEYEILGFIDNDAKKHFQTLQGYVIYPVDKVPDSNSTLVLIASEFYEQIKQQLMEVEYFHSDKIKALPARFLSKKHFQNDSKFIIEALVVLNVCCEVLAALAIKHHIDAGTLLGLYRDQTLIPWDDDLDIAVDSSGRQIISDNLELFVARLNLVSGGDWQAQALKSEESFGAVPANAVRAFKFIDRSDQALPAIDFFVKYVANGSSDYCLSSRGIRMPAEFAESVSEYKCHDFVWPIPGDTPGYLAHHYGNWQIPDPNWSLQKLENTQVFE